MGARVISGATARPPRVLVIDDDDDVRDLMARLLESAGFAVSCADGGRAALATLSGRAAPDAVVLDLMMPDVGGLDVLAAMRARPELRDVPVIVVTAAYMPPSAKVLGAQHLLGKPLDVGALVDAVSACTSGPRVTGQRA